MSGALSIDFETRSTLDLRRTGVYPYAEHETTEILCMAYAWDAGPTQLWVPGYSTNPQIGGTVLPVEVANHIVKGGEMRAWNAQFERIMWRDCLARLYPDVVVPTMEQWVCVAAEAAAMALPRHLGQCAEVLGADVQKDAAGHRLMLQMCKPRKIEKDGMIIWWEDEDRLNRLYAYCKQDVESEQATGKYLRRLSPKEREIYLLDQKINDRGVLLDVELKDAAEKVVKRETIRANVKMKELTNGEVTAVTKVADLTGWLLGQGLDIPNVKKSTVRDLLDGDEPVLTDSVRSVLLLRQEAGKSSNAKLAAMERARCSDDRVRGMLLYHGADTGRWAGRLVQPQNFPRGEVENPEQYIPDLLAGGYPGSQPPLVVVSALLRGMFRASPDCQIVSGDFSQIEARVLGWLAEQPYGDKEYERMGAAIYDLPLEEVTKGTTARQIGKNAVLGCGFQMGWEAFIAQVHEQTGIVLDEATARKAITTYRNRKSGIPALWRTVESAAMCAVRRPGEITNCALLGKVRYVVRGQFLWCILPSGRPLAYALPKIAERKTKYGPKIGLQFMGMNSYTRKWGVRHAYGGLLVENIVQAVARDLMADAMLRLEEAGYPLILTVHDEIVADVPDAVWDTSFTEGYAESTFQMIMETTPAWARGLDLKTDVWSGERYRK